MTDRRKAPQSLLDRIRLEGGYRFVLSLLLDRSDTHAELRCSFASAEDCGMIDALRNRVHRIPGHPGNGFTAETLLAEGEVFLQSIGGALAGPRVASRILAASSPFDDAQPDRQAWLGILVTAGEAWTDPNDVLLEQIADAITAARCDCFVSTMLCFQRNFSGRRGGTVDEPLVEAARLFATQIGASTFTYRNRNSGAVSSLPAAPPAGAEVLADAPSAHVEKGGETLLENESTARRSDCGDALEIALSQPSYEIADLAFGPADGAAKALKEGRSEAIRMSFRGKAGGCLQERFSEFDQRLAEAVFGSLQNFAELRLAEASYNQVLAILHRKAISQDTSAQDLLAILRQLSPLIDNVHILTVGLRKQAIDVTCTTADASAAIDPDYVSRLRAGYLEHFYFGHGLPRWDAMAVAMHAHRRHRYIAFHMPREFGGSRIAVVCHSQPSVAVATFNCLVNLFDELFIRTREADFQQALSNNMSQTRHALHHQLCAALHGADDIKSKLERGLRNRDYWNSLVDDRLFVETVDWSHWSLHQAQLILENGRYLLDQIDPKSIVRKPFNLAEIIYDAIRITRIEARRKSVRIMQRVRGDPPTVMTGDVLLMRMAILNLIDNAVKYSLNGGLVSCELLYRKDGYEFRITNRGDIIPEGSLSRLLQIGYRGEQQSALNLRPGTGLGLSVTYRILIAHSPYSRLDFSSEPHGKDGGGATNTFSFEMPYLTGLSNVAAP